MKNFDRENNETQSTNGSLTQKLKAVIAELPSGSVTLKQIMDMIGNDSLLFVSIFLSLVFLVPVSIPGVSTVFGSAILLIGLSQLFSGKLWLPDRIAHRTISSEKLTPVLTRALTWFHRLEKFSSQERLHQFTTDARIGLLNKLAFILAAMLLMVPFGFIPFSNTLPAISLIFLAIGAIQKDGRSIMLGHASNLVTILYFMALITGGGMTIFEVWQHFIE